MTRASVTILEGSITALEVTGHAGYAQKGQDIVCAAVSCLTTTCINALEAVAKVKPVVRQDEQAAIVSVLLPDKLSPPQSHDAQIVLQTALQGFRDIAGEYPKYFDLTIIDGRKTP